MATSKPLAEVRGAFKKTWQDIDNLYITFAVPFPDDWPVADGFLLSEWRKKVVVFQMRPLDDSFQPATSDPTQPLLETDVEDELARLRRQHQDLLAEMTNRNAEPPSEAAPA